VINYLYEFDKHKGNCITKSLIKTMCDIYNLEQGFKCFNKIGHNFTFLQINLTISQIYTTITLQYCHACCNATYIGLGFILALWLYCEIYLFRKGFIFTFHMNKFACKSFCIVTFIRSMKLEAMFDVKGLEAMTMSKSWNPTHTYDS
jgi:hypothetical protein